jgi:uncharacterized protein YcfJ
LDDKFAIVSQCLVARLRWSRTAEWSKIPIQEVLMTSRFVCAAALAAFCGCAMAQPADISPKAQFTADSKAAQSRYDADKALCNDESTSAARLQCRRDAKSEYDGAMTAAKARLQSAPVVTAPVVASAASHGGCADCGKVSAISTREEAGQGGAVGMIAGGVGGALLGRQVGGGSGKDLATIAGAVGGAYAGKKIEEKVRTKKVWTVSVQYPNGTKGSFEFDKDPGMRVGDNVRNSGKTVVRQ